jgi:hypothetical protein
MPNHHEVEEALSAIGSRDHSVKDHLAPARPRI